TIIYGRYYKRFNPKGTLYLKMDAYNEHLLFRKRYSKNPIKNFYFNRVEKRFFMTLNHASIENRDGLKLASLIYPEMREKIGYLPNGVNDQFLKSEFDQEEIQERIVLSVGRLGSADKNYELFLTAVPKLLELNCQFVIVGPISDEFQKKIDHVFKLHPKAEEKITFTGSISNRERLYELFAKSSVFFLPSRFESFGIAYTEALYFGACLVGHTGMYAFDDICSNGKYGTFYEDNNAESFANAIESALSKSEENGFREEAKNHARNNFVWSKLTQELLTKLGHG
ncbi:MAG: glycosyltransferase family 4 protein, partial [Bacteroidota bacterium]